MMSKGKSQTDQHPLAAYEPPRALRMHSAREGCGGITPQCGGPGSGAFTPCGPGVSAFDCDTGSGAAEPCALGAGPTIVVF